MGIISNLFKKSVPLKIMINPEHGGTDGGAAYGGLVEKTLNLTVAKYCRDYLEDYDCTVFLSRETDIDMGITARNALLKKEGANAVVTVAHNAGGGDGCEVFYWTGDGKSKALASALIKQYEAIGQNSRGIKVSSASSYNFGMVREPSKLGIVAVLSEFAFLDNKNDRLIVDSDADLRKEGVAIAKAVIEYFGLKKKQTKPVKPSQPETSEMYRVGTGWSNGKCLGQKGAFAIKQNALNFCDKCGAGYSVYDSKGNVVYSVKAPTAPQKGDKVTLDNANLYKSSTIKTPTTQISGTYYLYDGKKFANSRYRITNSADRCGKTPIGENVTGYVELKKDED